MDRDIEQAGDYGAPAHETRTDMNENAQNAERDADPMADYIAENVTLRADLADAQRRLAAVEDLIDPATQKAQRPYDDGARWFEEADIRTALSGRLV